MISNWRDFENYSFDDGKHISKYVPIKFPGYINNKEHPFLYCHALTHILEGKVSNKWCRSDGPAEFKQNLLKNDSNWKYRNQEITYKKNKSGYRTYEWDEIDWKNAIVLLGCSNTYGVGLDESETTASLLETLTQRQVINLGYPSGSNDLILQNSINLYEKFGAPYGVVINWTTIDRFTYYARDNYHDLGPWKTKFAFNNVLDLDEHYKLSVIDEHNLQVKNYYISKAANSIWKDKTKYITLSYFDLTAHYMRADKFFEIDNGARDMLHPGYGSSQQVAEYIFNRLK
jgi:hypothetical protein